MALARVQGTGKVRSNVTGTLALTFTTPPAAGNAVLLLVSHRYAIGPTYPASLTDSQGNVYTRSVLRTASTDGAVIYCCPLVTTSAAPFTITLNAGGGIYAAAGVEVSGVGSGLVLDQSATANMTGPTVTAGPMTALTAAEVILAAVQMVNANQASIAIETLSPPWVEEFEELDQTNWVAGEGDTRILPSGALGTTPRAQWVDATAGSCMAVIAAFKVSGSVQPPDEKPYYAVTLPAADKPFNRWQPLTPSDTLDRPFASLWCGQAGTVAAVMQDGQVGTITVPAGALVPIMGRRVNSTGTSVTNILALGTV